MANKGIRVNALARELGVESKLILQWLRSEGLGDKVPNHMTVIASELAEAVREHFSASAADTPQVVDPLNAVGPAEHLVSESGFETSQTPVDHSRPQRANRVLVSKLRITNFKPFGGEHELPLAPITLLFGPNSAGKSSVMQSLLLLKQTMENPPDFPELEFRGPLVDLRNFQSVIYRHDTTRSLGIGLDFRGWRVGSPPERHAVAHRLDFSVAFGRLPETSYGTLELGPIATWTPNPDENWLDGYRLRHIDREKLAPLLNTAWAQYTFKSDGLRRYLRSRLAALDRTIKGVREILGTDWRETEPERELLRRSMRQHAAVAETLVRLESDSYDFECFIDDVIRFNKSCLLDPNGLLVKVLQPVEQSEMFTAPALPAHPTKIVAPSLAHLAEEAADLLRSQVLRNLFYVGPLRKPMALIYGNPHRRVETVGIDGADTPVVLARNPEVLNALNSWLGADDSTQQTTGVGYRVRIEQCTDPTFDQFRIVLEDLKRGVNVTPRDVGAGIGQLLPILVEGLMSPRTVLLEQPELHLHPRIQANLGSFFAAQCKQSQFIVETHSEHLVLRLQKLVRDGKLSPESVSILCIGAEGGTTTITPLRLDREGFFDNEWPGGFFPDRVQELW